MLANMTTVQKWPKESESVGEWLRWDESEGKVSRIFCALCAKHVDRTKAIRNYSPAFIDGLVGSALKKDNVAKHKKFDMHGKAVNMELQPTRTLNSILTSTPLGKAFASVTTDESTGKKRVESLIDFQMLCY